MDPEVASFLTDPHDDSTVALAADDRRPVLVVTERGTYRAFPHPDPRAATPLWLGCMDRLDDVEGPDEDAEWMPWRHGVEDARFDNPGAATAAVRDWIMNTIVSPDNVTLHWVRTDLIESVAGAARQAGVDPTEWSLEQHAGLTWTLMRRTPGQPMQQLGGWARWQDARHALEGMAAAFIIAATTRT